MTGMLFGTISNQKLNTYLKVIADLCKVSINLTHKVARHTFGTTICLQNGISLEDTSKLLGHTNLKTTQIYSKITREA
jgi:site-specific recombinase XerD